MGQLSIQETNFKEFYGSDITFIFLSSPSLTEECNADCACTTAFYQPVCDDGVTYFSPCHAGCMDAEVQDDQVS